MDVRVLTSTPIVQLIDITNYDVNHIERGSNQHLFALRRETEVIELPCGSIFVVALRSAV